MSSTVVHKSASPVTDFGDVPSEFAAVVSDCGVYDLGSRGKMSITGKDRVRWLNGMITNNVRDLAAGRGVYAFLLSPQGHILGDLYAYNRGDSLLIDTDCSQLGNLLSLFDHYIIMDDVEVTNVNDALTAIGVAGPKARDILGRANIALPQFHPLQFSDLNYRDIALMVVRGDNSSIESYELWLAPRHVPLLWDALCKAGAKAAGATALELLRVASGVPRYGQDIRERDLPQETEQQRALHFNKGCYIGQEIVERIRSRGGVHRKFTGFEVSGPLPASGTKIHSDGKEVGEVTSTACLPSAGGEVAVALGYIRREVATPGKQVQAADAQLTVVTLPLAQIFPERNQQGS